MKPILVLFVLTSLVFCGQSSAQNQSQQRDPFADDGMSQSVVVQPKTPQNDDGQAPSAFRFRPKKIDNVPEMNLVGLITDTQGVMTAILDFNKHGEFVVTQNDIINLRINNANVAIRIKEISKQHGVIIETGKFEGVMIVK